MATVHDNYEKGGPVAQADPFVHLPDDDAESLAGFAADGELEAALAKILAHLRQKGGFLALRIAGLKRG